MQVTRPVAWALRAVVVAAVVGGGIYLYPRYFGGPGADPSVVRLTGVVVDTREAGSARVSGTVHNTGSQDLSAVEVAADCVASDDSGRRETRSSVGALRAGEERTFFLIAQLPPPAGGRAYHPHCETRVAGVSF